MDFIDRIGPILGIVAFLGLAIMTFLVILQAREVRRLRDWAGRAPERALEADEAGRAAAEARGETVEPEGLGSPAAVRERLAGVLGPRWEELDRRSPVDPRLLVAGIVVALIAVGVLTGGFGLGGNGNDGGSTAGKGGGGGGGKQAPKKIDVAVLNATQENGIVGVPGLADKVAQQAVLMKGFRPDVTTDAPQGVPSSVVMYAKPGDRADATALAAGLAPKLGTTATVAMTPEVAAVAGKDPLAVLIGRDDAEF